MISSLGVSKSLSNGLMVSQTIGQQSITGTSSGDKFLIQQGFQQALISKIVPVTSFMTIQTAAFPNPFVDIICFKFSQHLKGDLTVAVYDYVGRVAYKKVFNSPGDVVNVNLGVLTPQKYVVNLTATNYSYSTIIAKE
ncbi:hypothetical protein [Pedobacter cryophilus]|uniref:Secretion system C-terminal sorting domain-containing protein n=1 Tax=Pedobacter cryophilus TaxID=2571271 RepID=A0A4U1C3T5_9SPHI|nr:hypothetical protein [Pedobacter cryophilus]TKC00526.1 hypothetical protein FA046_02270 [Pedobacter cryophilus]